MRLAYLVSIALLFAGCATVDRGTIDHVRIDTVPQGAQVTVRYDTLENTRRPQDGRVVARNVAEEEIVCAATPCAIPLPRREDALVTIEHDGYSPIEYVVYPSNLRGGTGVDLTKTAAVTSGTGLVAGMATFSAISIGNSVGSLLTLGTQTNTFGNAAGNAATVGTGVGVGLFAVSLAADAGTKANSNLFPNPVVIGLTETDSSTFDPLVADFKAVSEARGAKTLACDTGQTLRGEARLNCSAARKALTAAERNYRKAKADREAAIKTARQALADAMEAEERP